MKRFLFFVAVWTALIWAQAHAGAELAVESGKMLNNTDSARPGWVGGIELSWTRGDNALRYRATRATPSYLSEWGSSTFQSLAATRTWERWTLGFGPVLSMNYDPAVWWQGKLYPNDLTHFTKSCALCGSVASLEYHFGEQSRWSIEGQYYAVQQMLPTFNGTIVVIKYRVGSI